MINLKKSISLIALSMAIASGQLWAQAPADNQELQKKAAEWVNELKLSDEGKKQKVQPPLRNILPK